MPSNQYLLLAKEQEVRYADGMETAFSPDIIRLTYPLLIPRGLDENLLMRVDTYMVLLWSQMVALCDKESISLAAATERMAETDPFHFGMPEWYFYKIRCLLRAYFLGVEVMTIPVEIITQERSIRFTFVESKKLGTTLLQMVQLGQGNQKRYTQKSASFFGA